MSTSVLGCGCIISHSMFGDRECMGLTICSYHVSHPEVQAATVAEVWAVILRLQTEDPKDWVEDLRQAVQESVG